jgi:hypothetical protein
MNWSSARFPFLLLDWSYFCAGTVDTGHQVERHAYFHPCVTLFLVRPKLVCLLLKPCFLPLAWMLRTPWMSRNNGLEKSTSYKTYKPREGPVRPTIHGHLTDLYPWYQCMAAPEIFSIAAQSSEAKPGELEAGYHELFSLRMVYWMDHPYLTVLQFGISSRRCKLIYQWGVSVSCSM